MKPGEIFLFPILGKIVPKSKDSSIHGSLQSKPDGGGAPEDIPRGEPAALLDEYRPRLVAMGAVAVGGDALRHLGLAGIFLTMHHARRGKAKVPRLNELAILPPGGIIVRAIVITWVSVVSSFTPQRIV